jgi:hypothetical protein
MIRLAYLVGATALAVVYYFAFGAGPSASEYLDDLEWWRPWGTAVRWLPFVELTALAREGLPGALLPLGLFWGPPLALFAGGLALFRKSAAARAYLLFLALTMCIFVWYGYRAEQVWRFFEWRFAAVATAFTAIVSVIVFSPSLLRGLARHSRVLAALAVAASASAIFVLSTEVTGTNSEMPFNVSPWPIVTLVGFLLVGATIAAAHTSGGAAVWLQKRAGGIGGFALGIVLSVIVGMVTGWIIFTAPGNWIAVAVIASVYALVCMVLATRDPVEARRSGLFRFAAGALLLLAIFGSNRVAALNQRAARDQTALDVLVALEAYKKERQTYPEKLDELVPDYVAEVPRPAIGLIRDEDDRFAYSNYGDSYMLEFASVLWVQCQYSPPYQFSAADPEELAEELAEEASGSGEEIESWEMPDVAAPREPTAEDLALAAKLAERGLEGSWSCPEEPPKLW